MSETNEVWLPNPEETSSIKDDSNVLIVLIAVGVEIVGSDNGEVMLSSAEEASVTRLDTEPPTLSSVGSDRDGVSEVTPSTTEDTSAITDDRMLVLRSVVVGTGRSEINEVMLSTTEDASEIREDSKLVTLVTTSPVSERSEELEVPASTCVESESKLSERTEVTESTLPDKLLAKLLSKVISEDSAVVAGVLPRSWEISVVAESIEDLDMMSEMMEVRPSDKLELEPVTSERMLDTSVGRVDCSSEETLDATSSGKLCIADVVKNRSLVREAVTSFTSVEAGLAMLLESRRVLVSSPSVVCNPVTMVDESDRTSVSEPASWLVTKEDRLSMLEAACSMVLAPSKIVELSSDKPELADETMLVPKLEARSTTELSVVMAKLRLRSSVVTVLMMSENSDDNSEVSESVLLVPEEYMVTKVVAIMVIGDVGIDPRSFEISARSLDAADSTGDAKSLVCTAVESNGSVTSPRTDDMTEVGRSLVRVDTSSVSEGRDDWITVGSKSKLVDGRLSVIDWLPRSLVKESILSVSDSKAGAVIVEPKTEVCDANRSVLV